MKMLILFLWLSFVVHLKLLSVWQLSNVYKTSGDTFIAEKHANANDLNQTGAKWQSGVEPSGAENTAWLLRKWN